MKLRDCVNLTKNKTNKQMSLNIKKKKLKEGNINIKDIMNLDIPLSKKLKKFEGI